MEEEVVNAILPHDFAGRGKRRSRPPTGEGAENTDLNI